MYDWLSDCSSDKNIGFCAVYLPKNLNQTINFCLEAFKLLWVGVSLRKGLRCGKLCRGMRLIYINFLSKLRHLCDQNSRPWTFYDVEEQKDKDVCWTAATDWRQAKHTIAKCTEDAHLRSSTNLSCMNLNKYRIGSSCMQRIFYAREYDIR